jgi:hypothetical protein
MSERECLCVRVCVRAPACEMGVRKPGQGCVCDWMGVRGFGQYNLTLFARNLCICMCVCLCVRRACIHRCHQLTG